MRRHVVIISAIATGGCLAQRDVSNVIDPSLRSSGVELRGESTIDGFVLGPRYVVRRTQIVRRPAAAPDGSLGGPRPGERVIVDVDVEVRDDGQTRPWSAHCESFRQSLGRSDYAAVSGDADDALLVRCELRGDSGSTWRFRAEGQLSANIEGRLEPVEAKIIGDALHVELLAWRLRFDRVMRHLPEPAAQVRMAGNAIAAMIFASPEYAWVASDAPSEIADASMTTLSALRLMPLGLD